METIRFKLVEGGFPPVAGHGDWIDLCAREIIKYQRDSIIRIPLGVALQLPEGYEAMLCLRSSTPVRYGILQANSPGVIDEKFCGDEDEICLLALTFRDAYIPAGTRIAQLRIFKKQCVCLEEVKLLGNPSRGGFGSTGN